MEDFEEVFIVYKKLEFLGDVVMIGVFSDFEKAIEVRNKRSNSYIHSVKMNEELE